MRRGFWAIIVVCVVAAAVTIAARRKPVDIQLAIDYGPRAAHVRNAVLIFRDQREHVVRRLELRYPRGAVGALTRPEHISRGEYDVGASVTFDEGPAATPSAKLRVDDEGTYLLNLVNLGP
jgi:hypothetical protein